MSFVDDDTVRWKYVSLAPWVPLQGSITLPQAIDNLLVHVLAGSQIIPLGLQRQYGASLLFTFQRLRLEERAPLLNRLAELVKDCHKPSRSFRSIHGDIAQATSVSMAFVSTLIQPTVWLDACFHRQRWRLKADGEQTADL